MKLDDINRIKKLLNNELDVQGQVDFYNELADNSELREEFYYQKCLWVKTGVSNENNSIENEGDLVDVWNRIKSKSRRIKLNIITRYAAVIVGTLLLSIIGGKILTGVMSNSDTSNSVYSFASGEKSTSTIELPDGSVLTLNAQTKVTYTKESKTNKRLITLEGEALFNVIHDEESPFVIDFGSMKVVDLGTIFNVKAYENSDVIQTTLFEGDVDIVLDDIHTNNLNVGQKATYSKSLHQVELSYADSTVVTAWTDNRFVFKGKPLTEIMDELSDWYETKIIWVNKRQMNETLYLNIKRSPSIYNILDVIAIKCQINYEEKINKDGQSIILIK